MAGTFYNYYMVIISKLNPIERIKYEKPFIIHLVSLNSRMILQLLTSVFDKKQMFLFGFMLRNDHKPYIQRQAPYASSNERMKKVKYCFTSFDYINSHV